MGLPIRSEEVSLEGLFKWKKGKERQVKGDPNAPLCPLLPSVKRNINNKVGFFLEGERFTDKKRIQ